MNFDIFLDVFDAFNITAEPNSNEVSVAVRLPSDKARKTASGTHPRRGNSVHPSCNGGGSQPL